MNRRGTVCSGGKAWRYFEKLKLGKFWSWVPLWLKCEDIPVRKRVNVFQIDGPHSMVKPLKCCEPDPVFTKEESTAGLVIVVLLKFCDPLLWLMKDLLVVMSLSQPGSAPAMVSKGEGNARDRDKEKGVLCIPHFK